MKLDTKSWSVLPMRPMPKDPRFEHFVFKFSLAGVVSEDSWRICLRFAVLGTCFEKENHTAPARTNHCPLGEPASDRVFTVEERTKTFLEILQRGGLWEKKSVQRLAFSAASIIQDSIQSISSAMLQHDGKKQSLQKAEVNNGRMYPTNLQAPSAAFTAVSWFTLPVWSDIFENNWNEKTKQKNITIRSPEQRHCEHEHCWRRRRHQRRRRRRRKILRKKRDDITQKMEEYCAMILRNRYYARCKKYCASIRKKGSVSRYYAGILRKHKTHQRSKQTFWCNQKYIGHGTSKINNSVLDLSTDNTMFWANYFWIFQC